MLLNLIFPLCFFFFLRQIHTYFLSNFQAYNAHQNYINKNEHIAGLPK